MMIEKAKNKSKKRKKKESMQLQCQWCNGYFPGEDIKIGPGNRNLCPQCLESLRRMTDGKKESEKDEQKSSPRNTENSR